MKRLLLSALAALGLATCAMQAPAQTTITEDQGAKTIAGIRVAAGYEQLSLSSGSATALASVPSPARPNNPVRYAVICAEAYGVRFRDDGVDPTATVGMPLPAGACFIYAANPASLKFIRTGSSTAIVNVLYYY